MRVFCASMADVFEDNVSIDAERLRLWQIIDETPMLDWLLLTKRPENMLKHTPWKNHWPANIWAMTSVENQDYAVERIPELMKVPATVRGLSVEPLLASVDLRPWLSQIQWVIVGGESGRQARAMNPEWVRDIRDQCLAANVAFFFKQWGEWAPINDQHVGQEHMYRAGKKAAGRVLDGQTWDELPDVEIADLDR